jgi:D-alanyl-D-alanine dipeptidase
MHNLFKSKIIILSLFFQIVFSANSFPSSNIKINKTYPPDGFVYLSKIDSSIKQDIRYATQNNFTGKIVKGYSNASAILTRDAALKLKLVQEDLKKRGLGLKVFDAYRPVSAVDEFLKWRKSPVNKKLKLTYYPNLSKEDLFKKGYIAPGKSSHSRGSTVDLTIVNIKTGNELDMGTPFDYFGSKSHTNYEKLPKKVKNNRLLLKKTMEKHDFENLPNEWWHYTLRNEPFKDYYFDFLIR